VSVGRAPLETGERAADIRADKKSSCLYTGPNRRGDPDICRRINDLIGDRSDIILNNSTGGGVNGDVPRTLRPGPEEISFKERIKGFEAGAEMAASDCHAIIPTRRFLPAASAELNFVSRLPCPGGRDRDNYFSIARLHSLIKRRKE
jgi:hypothetical protein